MESRGVAPGPRHPSPLATSGREARSSPEVRLWELLINELAVKMCSKCPQSQANGGLCPRSPEDIVKCMADTIAEGFRPEDE